MPRGIPFHNLSDCGKVKTGWIGIRSCASPGPTAPLPIGSSGHRLDRRRQSVTEALMDEGRNFPLPVTQSWAWENQVKAARVGCTNGGRPTFVTIATADRAGQSRIFARSARECHRDARLVVLALDPDRTPGVFEDLFDLIIPAEHLSLGSLDDMRFRYSIAELCFALK